MAGCVLSGWASAYGDHATWGTDGAKPVQDFGALAIQFSEACSLRRGAGDHLKQDMEVVSFAKAWFDNHSTLVKGVGSMSSLDPSEVANVLGVAKWAPVKQWLERHSLLPD
eukprot:999208-Pyramimonas_sp.AAC.1